MTLLLLLVAVTAAGVVATPGLAAAALLLIPLAILVVAWWIVLAAATHGRPTQGLVRVRHHEFLGPGGPDDPFAPLTADRAARDRRELEDQRRGQEDETQGDLVEVP
jgi:hypothetical protein